MSEMPKAQQVFQFVQDRRVNFENFYMGQNADVCAALHALADGANPEQVITLIGPVGSGRSHMLQAVCAQAEKAKRVAYYVPLGARQDYAVEMLDGLESGDVICIDDVDAVCGNLDWEEAIFHLYNRALSAGCHVVFALPQPANHLDWALADLKSRLGAGLLFSVQALPDDEKQSAIIHKAACRGMHLPPNVAQYMLTHLSRNMSELSIVLDQLDDASIQQGRAITVPLLRSLSK